MQLAGTPIALVGTPYAGVGRIAIANCIHSNIGVAGFSWLDRDMTCSPTSEPVGVEYKWVKGR